MGELWTLASWGETSSSGAAGKDRRLLHACSSNGVP